MTVSLTARRRGELVGGHPGCRLHTGQPQDVRALCVVVRQAGLRELSSE